MQNTELTLKRIIRAPRERVFHAWMAPDALKVWWGPQGVVCPEAEVDFRVGGEFKLANLQPDGSTTWISGRFERIRPPEEMVYTWVVSGLPGEPTLVTVSFMPHADGTELVIVHARFAVAAIRDGHLAGWEACVDKLEAYLAGTLQRQAITRDSDDADVPNDRTG